MVVFELIKTGNNLEPCNDTCCLDGSRPPGCLKQKKKKMVILDITLE